MILHDRRFVVLSVVAALVAGTALASNRVARPSPARPLSSDELLERAQRVNEQPVADPINQNSFVPQIPTERAKPQRREFTVYRNEAGEIVCREATAEEVKARASADLDRLGLRQINHLEPGKSVSGHLIAEANGEGNSTKQGIFNSLPATAVPTDLGDAGAANVSNSIARAIGLLPATAQSTDEAARIAFNSNFTFDFDPSDGIDGNAIDFDAVATHEIGHALGFNSEAGLNLPKTSVWDLYRFRTGTTNATFPTASRILTIGGSPDPLQFDFIPGNPEIGLSTGGPTGSSANGGDGRQSSHWKHVSTCSGYIGIMDPAIGNGCRRTITASDTLALSSFGYNLTNN